MAVWKNQLSYFLASTLFLLSVSCNNRRDTTAIVGPPENHLSAVDQSKISHPGEVLTISSELVKKFEQECLQDTVQYDRRFALNFVKLINSFKGRRLDTTLLTVGNIDGDSNPDSIFTRVYFEKDSIYVVSNWVKNNQVLWKDDYTNPYTDLNANLFDSTEIIWTYFGIGVVYGAPDFIPRNEVDPGVLSLVYEQGIEDLKNNGIGISKEQYKAYLRDFKGDLLIFGQPESRDRAWIWYKPASRMITYYQP